MRVKCALLGWMAFKDAAARAASQNGATTATGGGDR
jgi:NifU-like protein involved in Fe-S cluster formation